MMMMMYKMATFDVASSLFQSLADKVRRRRRLHGKLLGTRRLIQMLRGGGTTAAARYHAAIRRQRLDVPAGALVVMHVNRRRRRRLISALSLSLSLSL